MHPLVRNLYKRALLVGLDYPKGLEHVKRVWKEAIRNPKNCPSCYDFNGNVRTTLLFRESGPCYEELLRAVNRGRKMVKEMIGVVQTKKYRTMNKRYGEISNKDPK